jgi:hypothetical protein
VLLSLYAYIALALGSFLLLYGYRTICNDKDAAAVPVPEDENIPHGPLLPTERQREEERKHTLEVYSQLWKKREDQKNTLKGLAKIWRDNIKDGGGEVPDKPVFLHREIRNFFKDHVDEKPFFVGSNLRATVDLLQFLDTKGKCPSVVNKHKEEPDRSYDSHVYAVLKKITLYEHTINTAREIIKLAPEQEGPMVPKAVIAALAHDIGKATQFYDRLHTTGIHAFVGISVLDKIPSVKELKYYDDIVDAVKNHHRNPAAQLGQMLKKADHEARRKEFTEYDTKDEVEDVVEQEAISIKPPKAKRAKLSTDAEESPGLSDDTVNAAEPPITSAMPLPKTMKEMMTRKGIDTVSTPEDLFGSKSCAPLPKDIDLMGAGSINDSRKNNRPTKVPIPWWDYDTAMRLLGDNVNRVIGNRWNALSTNDGTVYVRQEGLYSLAEKLSGGCKEIKMIKADEQKRKDIIYSMVLALRAENAIETSMCRADYIGSLFVINSGKEDSHEIYLTPIKAEKFPQSLTEMEKRKSELLRKIEIKLCAAQ